MTQTTKALTVTEARRESMEWYSKEIEDRREQLGKLLVGQDVDRFITATVAVIVNNPDLLDADRLSVLSAVREAATHGLEPVGPLGDGAIIAYKEQGKPRAIAQFQPMYRGLMKLARRSGEVASIDAQVVYEKDDYLVELGTEPRIVHRPAPLGQERGKYVGAYAFARMKTGELVIVELSLPDIEKVRGVSKAYRNAVSRGKANSVWHVWPEPMMLKTALKRLMKKLPLEPKATKALAYDDTVEAGTDDQVRPQRAPLSEAKGRLVSRLVPGLVDGPGGDDPADSGNDAAEQENGQDDPVLFATEELTDEEIDELLEDKRDLSPEAVTEPETDEEAEWTEARE